jgi:hypothetical protein
MANDVIEMEVSAAPAQPAIASRSVAMSTPSDLLRMAVEQGADIEKLERLMLLQDRWEANQARKAYVEAMAAFKSNAPKIYKDKNVSFTGTTYNHATLGGICEVVIASLAKHGISHRWDTTQPGNGMIIVTCILTHMLGHSESTALEAPPDNSGKKNGIQQLASTVTYLQRYTLLGACGLATKDMPDDDGRGAGSEKEKVKTAINGIRFAKAIEAVKSGSYSAANVRENFTLTVDQETALTDAEKEIK